MKAITNNPRLKAALSYAQRGWSVLPLHSRQKTPFGKLVPHGLHNSTTDPDEIKAWWTKGPFANVGIRTGKVSGIVVLDIDPRNGGSDSFQKLQDQIGKFPETVTATTGGGGQHLLFLYPGTSIPCKPLGKDWPGLDIKGDGGYIVAPPSIHPSGKTYQWLLYYPNQNSTPNLAPLPPSFLELINNLEISASRKANHQWREMFKQGVKVGARNMTIASLVGHLLVHRIDPIITAELMLAWNKVHNYPPLTKEEVLSTVDSIAKKELQRRQKMKRLKT